jgi:hypothetical protein
VIACDTTAAYYDGWVAADVRKAMCMLRCRWDAPLVSMLIVDWQCGSTGSSGVRLNGIGPDELITIARQLPQGVTRP